MLLNFAAGAIHVEQLIREMVGAGVFVGGIGVFVGGEGLEVDWIGLDLPPPLCDAEEGDLGDSPLSRLLWRPADLLDKAFDLSVDNFPREVRGGGLLRVHYYLPKS
jgi:hypothetical protein